MAENEERKARLIATLDRSRREMSEHSHGARSAMNVSRRVRTGFRSHTALWVVGSAAVGAALAWLPSRRKKTETKKFRISTNAGVEAAAKAPLYLVLGKLVLDVTRPFLLKWVTSQIEPLANRWISGQMRRGSGATSRR